MKNSDDPLESPSLSLIVGSTGSGKSTLVANLLLALQKKHQFSSALFVSGNISEPIIDALEMEKTSSPTRLSEFITELKQAKPGTNHILVLDDIQGNPEFNTFSNRSEFVNFMLRHRHFGEDKKRPDRNGTWVIITAQTLKGSFSTTIRDQIKNFFLYYPNRNPSRLKDFEQIAQDPVAMRRAMALLKSRGPHQFLFLNKHNPERDRYFIGFKEELTDLN